MSASLTIVSSPQLEPVELELHQHHPYKSKGKRTRGCAVCNEAKTHRDHLGAPPSLNFFASNGYMVYRAHKDAWQTLLLEQLQQSGLPKGLGHVLAEGMATFPDRRQRDQGNHRFMLEKALGDALQAGGWLADDDWDHYEFGNLQRRYEKGVSSTRLMLFPTGEKYAAEAS